MTNYEALKVSQLRAMCKEKKIDTSSMLEKIEFVRALQKKDPQKDPKRPPKYEDMKVSELKNKCRLLGINTDAMIEKAEFVKALQDKESPTKKTVSKAPDKKKTPVATRRASLPGKATVPSKAKPKMGSSSAQARPVRRASNGSNSTGIASASSAPVKKSTPINTARGKPTLNYKSQLRGGSVGGSCTSPKITKKPSVKVSVKPKMPSLGNTNTKKATTANSPKNSPKTSRPITSAPVSPKRRQSTIVPAKKVTSPMAKRRPTIGVGGVPTSISVQNESPPTTRKPPISPTRNNKKLPVKMKSPPLTRKAFLSTDPSLSSMPSLAASSVPSVVSAASRNSTNYTATDVETLFKDAPKSKWIIKEHQFSGSLGFKTIGEEQDKRAKSIQKALDKFYEKPHKYAAIMYQTHLIHRPAKEQSYTLVMRKGTQNLQAKDITDRGKWTIIIHHYQHIPTFPFNKLPDRDQYTNRMTHKGNFLPRPILPGRGMGCCDLPSLKIIGDIDPSDIKQGEVGDCWLLSAISAIAEFDGAVKRLFRKTKNLEQMPRAEVNFYTITLWDLSTWKEVDIVIDESLCASPSGNNQLLASKPSDDGELWVPYLEKALCIHCGGWDEITGGQCTHAWAVMTGCRQQYTIMQNKRNGKFQCMAKIDPETGKWAKHFNSPKKGMGGGAWRCPWPKVGGGGAADVELTADQLYKRMCAWDRQNYIVAAGTKGSSHKNSSGGLVDNHAYSVIDCHPQVAGTKIDLMKVRNPWGSGEMEDGEFDDDGPGWDKYPQIKAALNPVVADDGIFYMTKKEFFQHFDHLYLSASDMTQYKED